MYIDFIMSSTSNHIDSWTTVETKKKKRPIGKQPWSDYVRNITKEKEPLIEEKKPHIIVAPKTKGLSKLTALVTPTVAPITSKITTKIISAVQKQSEKEVDTGPHALTDSWDLWFYDMAKMKDASWSACENEKLFSFSTVEDFWILYNNLTDLTNGMYYLMRVGYPPIWDDPSNINGGGWTFKIDKRNLAAFWKDLSCYCVGESLCAQSENIVGLSISPKVRNVTVRVWTKNTAQTCDLYDKLAKDTETSSVVINFRRDARFTSNAEAMRASERPKVTK